MISELRPGGAIIPVYQFGFPDDELEAWKVDTIEAELPLTYALKTNDFVWLADKKDWYHDYPNLNNYKVSNAETLICWPIHIRGSYMSIMGITFGKVVARTHEFQNFLETIGGLVGLQVSSLKKFRVSVDEDPNVWNMLSNRQHKIVTMISEGRTNHQIASELGYSQSTIRQETIKIYEILGVAGRNGAATAYRSNYPAFAHTSSPQAS